MNAFAEVLENVNLKAYNSYGLGNKTKYLLKPYSIDDLIKLIDLLDKESIPWYILGKGTNVILPDEDYNGAILILDHLNQIEIEEDRVIVEAGCILSKVINDLLSKDYTNLTPLYGIPGTIGGAIVGNVGANGQEIFDNVIDVTYLDLEKKMVTKKKEEIEYSYRRTEFKEKKCIVLKATLAIRKGNVKDAKEQMQYFREKRRTTQPLSEKNAGSVFANPKNDSAGRLIDTAGLKGHIKGGAKVSEKHANFIINFASAKTSDIIELIQYVKEEVKKVHKVELKLEQVIVKW